MFSFPRPADLLKFITFTFFQLSEIKIYLYITKIPKNWIFEHFSFLKVTCNCYLTYTRIFFSDHLAYLILIENSYLRCGIESNDCLWFESERKTHLSIFTTMEHLNKVYSIPNTILTIRERFSFAFYLHFWLRGNSISDLILGSANFCRTGIIFYCFQLLKNEVLTIL